MRAVKLAGLAFGVVLLLTVTSLVLRQLEASGRAERLVQAVDARDHAAVSVLLAHGADPNTYIAFRMCGLQWGPNQYNGVLSEAVERGDSITARLLLRYGAAPFAAHSHGKWLLRRDLVYVAKQHGDEPLAVMLRAAQKTAPKSPHPNYPCIDYKARERQKRALVVLGAPAAAGLRGGWWAVTGSLACFSRSTWRPGVKQLFEGMLLLSSALLLCLILVPIIQ